MFSNHKNIINGRIAGKNVNAIEREHKSIAGRKRRVFFNVYIVNESERFYHTQVLARALIAMSTFRIRLS